MPPAHKSRALMQTDGHRDKRRQADRGKVDRQTDCSTASVQQARLRANATTSSGRSGELPKPSHNTRQGHVAPSSRRSKKAKGKLVAIAHDASPLLFVRRAGGRIVR